MITFWQKSKFSKNSFCTSTQAKASHFRQNGEDYQPINELPVDAMKINVRINVQPDEEPLVIPTMDESKDTETPKQSDALTIPNTVS